MWAPKNLRPGDIAQPRRAMDRPCIYIYIYIYIYKTSRCCSKCNCWKLSIDIPMIWLNDSVGLKCLNLSIDISTCKTVRESLWKQLMSWSKTNFQDSLWKMKIAYCIYEKENDIYCEQNWIHFKWRVWNLTCCHTSM